MSYICALINTIIQNRILKELGNDAKNILELMDKYNGDYESHFKQLELSMKEVLIAHTNSGLNSNSSTLSSQTLSFQIHNVMVQMFFDGYSK